jgi:hypothetical protein
MNYKETLFFIGKCLTISHEKHNRNIIYKSLRANTIDWDSVVKVSTGHFVFPALYCSLKRADFLNYLPSDLVEYMKHITDLNRERNQQIIAQAKEINVILLANNITPIFLKGTGNILEGLYDDIAERMIGDIDILIKKEDCLKAFQLLQKNNYKKTISLLFEDHRHLPRIVNSEKIAAIEIHMEMLKIEKSKFFNYENIKKTLILNASNNCTFLSNENKLKLTIYSKLINDEGYFLKKISLRAAYDFFLIVNKSTNAIHLTDKNLSKELSAGIEIYTFILKSTKKIIYNSNKKSKKYLENCLSSADNSFLNIKKYQLKVFILNLDFWLRFIFKSFFRKSYLKFILSRITSIDWYKRRFFGVK